MAWSADTDERVLAVRDWAERTGWTSWTDDYTNDEIAVLIQFTRTGEGAIKKYCRQVGIVIEPEPVVKEGRRNNFVDLHDPDVWAVEHEAAVEPVKRPTCPTCFLIVPATGVCCEGEVDVKLLTFADVVLELKPNASVRRYARSELYTAEELKPYNADYERGWKAAGAKSAEGALDRADKRGEVSAWYDGYHDHAAGRAKWTARDTVPTA